jgi:hypothetical protein
MVYALVVLFGNGGIDVHDPFQWICFSVLSATALSGALVVWRRWWAVFLLPSPVLLISLYAAYCCYFYLFHARFGKEFWLMAATFIGGLVTAPILIAIISINIFITKRNK